MNNATEQQCINVMVDLETLGTQPGCKLLSIGAVTFCTHPDAPQEFYEKIDKNSYPAQIFHSDLATIQWWSKQSEAARDEAFSGTHSIVSVLEEFDAWLKHLNKRIIFWGNGADFDNSILQETYRRLDMKQPWDFRDNRCYRTLKNLYPQVAYIKPKMAHNALEDARAQAIHAESIVDTVGIRV